VTGIRELGHPLSPAPEHVRVSVMGGHTQLDVALPLDVPVASLVPELVKLVGSRGVETPTDTPWPAAQHTFWALSQLDPVTPLQPNETLRAAGVVDGELLHLTEQRSLSAPTLYDDVVDAAARLNKAAHAGWNTAAARWMSFGGLFIVSLVWVYLVVDAMAGAQRVIIVGSAVVVVAAMAGFATLAHRWYGQADIGTVVGWSTIPISAAIVWVLLRGFGEYGMAVGCGLLVVLNAAWYWAVGTGSWGYLANGVLFTGSGLAVLSYALGVNARTVGVVLAVAATLACLTVSRLTGRLARLELPAVKPDTDGDALVLENPFTPQVSATGADAKGSSATAMPTAEAVWARVRSATLTESALYAGLGASVVCGAATALRAEPGVHWAALVFAGVCAAALGLHARVPGSSLGRVSLGVPAATLVVTECVSAQGGSTAMAWSGFAALLAVAVVAAVIGLRVVGGNLRRRWATALAYLQYAVFAALIPAALWAIGVYAQLEIR
jgi:type VII secretion integral membrane protein EccD